MSERALSRRGFLGLAAGATGLTLLPGLARPTVARAGVATLACWGDSLTYGVGGNGITYPDLLAGYLGISVYNAGVIGERTSGAAVRQGGRRPEVGFPPPSEPLPPRTFRAKLDPRRVWYEKTYVIDEDGVLPGTISGVHGVLNKQGDYRNEFTPYFFTRDDGLEPPVPGLFAADSGVAYAGVDGIIWTGHNDLRLVNAPRLPQYLIDAGLAVVQENIASMAAYARAGGTAPARFLVLSLLNGKGAGNGAVTGRPTKYHEVVVRTLNPVLAATYGPEHYVDVRSWLVHDALAYGGLTPTPQDLLDIQEDIPPSQLTVRSTTDPHLNETGYTLVAQYLRDQLVARGWYPPPG